MSRTQFSLGHKISLFFNTFMIVPVFKVPALDLTPVLEKDESESTASVLVSTR